MTHNKVDPALPTFGNPGSDHASVIQSHYCGACDAVRAAKASLWWVKPNIQNYQHSAEGYDLACAEHDAQVKQLQAILDKVEQLAEHCYLSKTL